MVALRTLVNGEKEGGEYKGLVGGPFLCIKLCKKKEERETERLIILYRVHCYVGER